MIKKSLSILFLLIYLGVIYMPYAPYVYIVVVSENPKEERSNTNEISFNSNNPLIGDICYIKAIKKRAENNLPENTKEQSNLIVINNLEYVTAFTTATCLDYVKKETNFIDYTPIIKNLVIEVDSPPPKQS